MDNKDKREEIKNKVTVPMYFYNIIVPNLGDYYVGDYPVDFDMTPVAKCPLHDEDTPSMRYYEETNSFYCFGCGAGGDVINLHRMFMEKTNGRKPTFRDAVDFLYRYFIEGKETTVAPIIEETKEKLNEPKDIVRLNYYRLNLEKSLSFDPNIGLADKIKIWEVLDNIDLLIDMDVIKSKDAKQYIQDKVKEIIR